jgi:hypothetical protein
MLLEVFHHASKERFGVHCFDVSPASEGNDVATQAPARYRVSATSDTMQGRGWAVVGANVVLPWE